MPITATVHAEFTCEKCRKTIPLSYRQEDDRQTLDSCLSKCVEAAKKKGWRVVSNAAPFVKDAALCPWCDKKWECSHGSSYGFCVKEDCTHKSQA